MDRHVRNLGNFKQYQPAAKKRPSFISFFKRNRQSNPITARIGAMPQVSHRYPQTSQTNTKNWRRRIVIFTLIAIFFTWIGLMLYLPYFRINKVEFVGLTLINAEEINKYINDKYLASQILPKNNYFLVNKNTIAKDVAEKYATTKVEVTKVFPGVLNIIIEEKITSIIYDNGSNYALLDNNGTVVLIISNNDNPVVTSTTEISTTSLAIVANTASSSVATADASMGSSTPKLATEDKHSPDWRKLSKSYSSVPIIYDTRRLTISDKQENILTTEYINAIIELQSQIHETGVGEVRYFTTENPVAGVSAITNKPWKLLLQPSNSIADQITNLKTLLGGNNIQPVEYIDLRYGERVFWK